MKSISTELAAHLLEEVTSLATCWRLVRTDGVEFYFTDHDTNLTIDGNIYLASSGYKRTAIANNSTLSVDNLDLEGVLDSESITVDDLRAGVFDSAEVYIFIVNWADLTQGVMKMRRGRLGEVVMTEQGVFKTELRGLTQYLSQRIGEVYTPECRADLGDTRCKVPVKVSAVARETAYTLGDFVAVATATSAEGQAQYENRIYECMTAGTTAATSAAPTYSTTVGTSTTDGTAVFTAREAWTRHGVVDTVTDRKTFTLTSAFDDSRDIDDWFNHGALMFESGANDGRLVEIRDWVQSTRTITLFFEAPFVVTAGTRVWLYPGCDKRSATCSGKFYITDSTDFPSGKGNIENYRGEPFLPGQDVLTNYPDAN
jgi:hypothetical protein